MKALLVALLIVTLLGFMNPWQAQAQAGNYVVADFPLGTLWKIPPPAGPPTAIYSGAPLARPTSVDVEPPEKLPVSGLVMPVNKLEILTPYLALAGLIAASSAVVVVRKRR